MLEGIKKSLVGAGFLTADTVAPVEPIKETVAASPIVGVGNSYQVASAIGVSSAVNEDLLQMLVRNIESSVVPNNLKAVQDMAETLKAAIVDEGTRIKAAAAALKLTSADIDTSIMDLVNAVAVEKDRFIKTDIASTDSEIQHDTDTLNSINAEIGLTIQKLNGLTAERDTTIAVINQKQVNRDTKVATFEATSAKIIASLEGERNRIKIYLPQGATS